MPILGVIASQNYSRISLTGYNSIATTTVGSGGQGTVSFTSIPSVYKHLQIRIMGLQTTGDDVFIKVNSDAGVRGHWLMGNGSTLTMGSEAGTASGQYFGTFGWNGSHPAVYVVDILDYTNTNKTKTIRSFGGYDANGSGRVNLISSLFTTTSVISSVTFTSASNIAQNSSFALYGIEG